MMDTFIFTLGAVLLYVTATTRICVGPVNQGVRKYCGKRPTMVLGGLAVSSHGIVLFQEIFTPMGLNFGFFNAVSLMSGVIVVILLFASWKRPVENLALVFFPVAALCVGLAEYFPSAQLLPKDKPFGFQLHLVSSIFAYSLLSLATLQALFLWLQDYHLRHKHPGRVMQFLPPLQVMEDLLIHSVAVGFVLLSLSLLSGFMYLEDMFAQHVVHHTVLAVAAWLIFASLLWGRERYGWRGRKVIRHTLWGFLFLMLAYFGSKFVLELILKR